MVFHALFGISRRWEMILMLCSGVVVVYTLRVNISVAAPKMMDTLDWNEVQKGYVLSSFYWGYTLGQLPASWYAQRYGSKLLFGLSILIPSLLTLLVPVICKISFGLTLFVRMSIGFFESASFPAIYHFFPHWIPLEEKTVMVSTTIAGSFLGEIIAFSLSGLLVDSDYIVNHVQLGGWPSVFYVFGMVGIVWFPFWMYFAYETPADHPYMNDEERAYILQGLMSKVNMNEYGAIPSQSFDGNSRQPSLNLGAPLFPQRNSIHDGTSLLDDGVTDDHLVSLMKVSTEKEDKYRHISVDSKHGALNHGQELESNQTPWREFLRSPAALTLLFAGWTNGWIGFMLLSEMPSYFKEQLGFDLSTAGVLCVAPYAGMLLTTISFGELFKYLLLRRNWQTRSVRQCAQFIAFGGAAICLILAGYMNSWPYVAYVFIVLSQMCLGANQSGYACSYLDLAPNFSGQYNAAGNTLSALAGIVGPLAVAQFTVAYPGSLGWRATFFLTAGICGMSLLLWAQFQTSEIIEKLNRPVPVTRNREHSHDIYE